MKGWSTRVRVRIPLVVLAVGVVGAVAASPQPSAPEAEPVERVVPARGGPLLPAITPDGPTRFQMRARDAVAFFDEKGIALALRSSEGGWALRWSLAGARPTPPRPQRARPGKVHQLVGRDRAKWKTGLPAFAEVSYPGVLEGADLTVEARHAGVAYRLNLRAGRAGERVRARVEGVESVRVVDGGLGLELRAGGGTLTETGLRCFHPASGGEELEVPCRYAAAFRVDHLVWEYEIETKPLDPRRELVIDPYISWSTYLGGSGSSSGGHDEGYSVAVHRILADSPVSVCGRTWSATYPTTFGTYDRALTGFTDAFVARIKADGSDFVWSTYLGGSSTDTCTDLAVDGYNPGSVLVVGETHSTDFPAMFGQVVNAGSSDAFATLINSDGTYLRWSTLLGGSGADSAFAVALDGSNKIYVVGSTSSTNFPVQSAFQTTLRGTNDGFVAKLEPDSTPRVYVSYLGGTAGDSAWGVAVDGTGAYYVTGQTASTDFPVAGGFGSTFRGGGTDAFVTKVNANGTLGWSSYLGGSAGETGIAIAVDASSNVFVAGVTGSANFPSNGGFDTQLAGTSDAFLTKVSSAGSSILWSTFLGGSGTDSAYGLAIDSAGNAYLTGNTSSTDFPLLFAFDSSAGALEAFVTRVNAAGNSLGWSSYLGGSGDDYGEEIALDSTGTVWVGGRTRSADFFGVGGLSTALQGERDAFVIKLPLDTTPPTGTVRDGPTAGSDLAYQTSTSSLSANWTIADPETGVSRYEWAIGTVALGTDVQGFTVVAGSPATRTGLALTNGATYYVTVRATNFDGYSALIGSNGVRVDSTAPVAGTVRDGTGADLAYQTSTSSLSANWSGFTDAQSGITGYAWAIGTTPGGQNVRAFANVGTSVSATATGLTLAAGATYYVTVRATNGAGLTVTASSNGVEVDPTPPSAGTVTDGTGADIDYQTSQTSLSASWSGFTDPEAGISQYEWAIGTTAGGTNVRTWASVGTALSATATGLSLVQGTTYYATVRATNAWGGTVTASSDGVRVDATPPSAGTVWDGPGTDIDVQASTTDLQASWSGFSDPESALGYSWAIGTTAGASDVRAFTSVGAQTSAAATGLSLSTGTTYFVTVRATNGAGLSTSATSDGVMVDATAPSAGSVNDGAAADIELQASETTLAANWFGFADGETGIASYEWAIGTTAGASDVRGFQAVGLATSASDPGLTLAHNTRYFVTVRATNGAGLTASASSNGVTVDATAPTSGVVADGPGADVDLQASSSTLSANWSGFEDPESGVALIEWALGTSPGGEEVQPFTAVGTASSASSPGLALTNGQTYYVTVRATNGVGRSTTTSSDGVQVNVVPPEVGTVHDGVDQDIDFQASTTAIAASWFGFSDPTGITLYEWAIGTAAGALDVRPFTPVGTSTAASAGGLSLSHGSTYFVTVRVTNGSGGTAVASSDGVKIDTTAPERGTVNDGPGADIDFRTSADPVSANWTGFIDPEGSPVTFEWAIGSSPLRDDLLPFAAVGAATEASATLPGLAHGARYFVTVRATNASGLSVEASSDGVAIDDTPPVGGQVNDGPGPDLDVLVSSTTVEASWAGFDDPESGVAGYAWAIGTTPGGTEIQEFVDLGTVDRAVNSAVSLPRGSTCYVTVRAQNGVGLTSEVSSDGARVEAEGPGGAVGWGCGCQGAGSLGTLALLALAQLARAARQGRVAPRR